ncbi:MAG: CRISPR-associated protein Cas4 [Akkermansiaceae bacterium]|nr:CRISPR-associated protein Cas4 [Akkermansiaceae bacterium]
MPAHSRDPKSIPLSALQHYLFCPRQCALIHNEQVWAENQFTAEGQLLHKKANEGPDEHRASGTILRHLHVSSETYNLNGICDIVERSPSGILTPVEYKRGKPKSHRADEVQVCAQAICLEEMFQTHIPEGHIYYGKTKRRTAIALDEEIRDLTLSIISQTTALFSNNETPTADYLRKRCDACSLIDLCMPGALRLKRGAKRWFQESLATNPQL